MTGRLKMLNAVEGSSGQTFFGVFRIVIETESRLNVFMCEGVTISRSVGNLGRRIIVNCLWSGVLGAFVGLSREVVYRLGF